MDTTKKKQASEFAKIAGKKILTKSAEATGDLIGNETADKITSLGKSKNKEKENEINEPEEIFIPPEKRQQIIDDLRFFTHSIKMEHQKITNLLGNTSDKVPRFITKKWIEVHDQSGETYSTNKQIRFKTSMLRSDLCDYSDAYIVVKGKIIVTAPNNDAYDKKLAFKNNTPFTSCIFKINNTLIDDVEDLDILTPMYSLIEYSKNYKKTTGSVRNYYRDEPNSSEVGNINYSIKDSKSFNYKTSNTGKLEGNNVEKDDVEIAVPLKCLGNFFRSLKIPLINFVCNCVSLVSLTLIWSENCVITSKARREADPEAEPAVAAINNATNAIFKIKDTKLYVPVVTLSAENDNKPLEQLKTRFKRTIKWNKYRSEMSNQTKKTIYIT